MYAWITGMEKMRQNLKDTADFDKHGKAMEQTVEETARLMEIWCPRFTGFMQETIKVTKIGRLSFTISTSANYAQFTEYGTRYIDIGTVENPKIVKSMSGKMSYRPWMRPAIWHMMNKYPQIMNRAIFGK